MKEVNQEQKQNRKEEVKETKPIEVSAFDNEDSNHYVEEFKMRSFHQSLQGRTERRSLNRYSLVKTPHTHGKYLLSFISKSV